MSKAKVAKKRHKKRFSITVKPSDAKVISLVVQNSSLLVESDRSVSTSLIKPL